MWFENFRKKPYFELSFTLCFPISCILFLFEGQESCIDPKVKYKFKISDSDTQARADADYS